MILATAISVLRYARNPHPEDAYQRRTPTTKEVIAMLRILNDLRTRLQRFADRLGFLGPALIRLTVGVVFIQSGWGKLHTLDEVTKLFTDLHIPLPGFNAILASSTEFFGGILILVGLGARLVALPLAFTMVVAIITAQREQVEGLASLVGLTEWSYLVMFLAIALRGPGGLSLDGLLARLLSPKPAAELPRPQLAPRMTATTT
jgi:putative oxidoreductase